METVPGVETNIYIPDDGNRYPTLKVSWDQKAWGFTVADCVQALRDGDPVIEVLGADNPSLVKAVREGNPNPTSKEHTEAKHIELVSMTIQPGKKSSWGKDCAPFWARHKRERPQPNGLRKNIGAGPFDSFAWFSFSGQATNLARAGSCGAEARARALASTRSELNTTGRPRMKLWVLGWLLGFAFSLQAQVGPAVPSQESLADHRTGPSSVDAGDYIYISGQGPRGADGALPATFATQVRQALDNLKSAVETAGLTVDHVVYTTVYLTDISKYAEMNSVFAGYFGKIPPARAVLGVASLPDPPIQINAVAVRSLSDRRAIYPPNYKSDEPFSPGILTHDRLFVSAMPDSPAERKGSDDPAAQVDVALDRMKAVVEAAGLELGNMVFVNPYLTARIPMRIMNEHYARRFEFGNTPARATIEVSSLPGGAQVEYTGVAVRDLGQRRAVRPKNMPPSPTASPCVFAGDTLYCSAKSGFIPGPNGGVYSATTAVQLRQTMRNQLDNLEEADMNFDQVVSTVVYLDNLADAPVFDSVYVKYFHGTLPSRTTVQQIAPADRAPDKDRALP